MVFRHRDSRVGRLIETVEVFQAEEEISKDRERGKGHPRQPKRLCTHASALPGLSQRQSPAIPFARVLVDG